MTFVPISHEQFEREHRDEREYAQHHERTRQARWMLTHDSLDGYRPARDFPCPGWLHEVEQVGGRIVIQCGECRYETTISRQPASAGSDW